MLRARCIAEGVRAVYPAAIGGMIVSEEAMDTDHTEKDITPRPAIAMPKAVEQDQTAKAEAEPVEAVPRESAAEHYISASEKQIGELRARLGVYGVTEQALLDEFFLGQIEQLPASRVAEASKFIKANATVKSA
jgi:hypothetical protein